MKLLETIKERRVLVNIGILVLGIALGWILFGGSSQGGSGELMDDHSLEDHQSTTWTCSMHPQIRENEPGSCPICGMDLIALESDAMDDESGAEFTVRLSNAAMKIAEVEMSTIERRAPYKEIYLPGKVMADERRISELTSRFPGRIEKLFVNFTGQKVRKGQVLAKVYSPELVTAQSELFEAIKYKDTNPNYYRAARNKLRLWDLTDGQIDEVENSGEVTYYFEVLSPITGTVTMRHVAIGDYVKEGTALFEVVDLSRVWVMFDAYETDIPWIKTGDKITFGIKSIPGKKFISTVTFIDPVINPASRVTGVRAELENRNDELKPHMLTAGVLKTMLPGSDDQLLVPKSSVLWTGKKAVVYVMTGDHNNMFQYREIDLGAEASNYYVVASGLEEGEMVASNGVFKIDAAAQLKGEQSMMNPEGGKVSMGHNHGGDSGGEKDEAPEHENPDVKTSEEAMKMSMSVDMDFRKQLTAVYLAQLDLQQAFIATDAEQTRAEVVKIEGALDEVDMSLVKGEMHNHWMASLGKLNKALNGIKESEDIEKQRLAYADFSDALYTAIKMFGTAGETIYYQYCPMAKNNEGAYWLSSVEEIKNPYFGDAMLTCGNNEEIIKSDN